MSDLGISIFIGLYFVVTTFSYGFIDYISKDVEYKVYFKIRRIRFIVFASLFAIFNFIVGFFNTNILFLKLLIIFSNVLSLGYFFLDVFYIQEKNVDYICALESLVYKRVKIKDIFIIEVDKAKYLEEKKLSNQDYSIITRSDGAKCICYKYKGDNLILIPKKTTTREELEMYRHLLSLEDGFDEMSVPVNNESLLEFYMNYSFAKPSKLYSLIKRNDKKVKTILQIIAYGFLLSFSSTIAISYSCGFDILDFLFSYKI